MADFVVQNKAPRELTQEDVDTLVKWTTDEGWTPYVRPNDISHMYGGPPYVDAKIFFGFLDGKRIGHVVLMTYGDNTDLMEYIAVFIVEKSLRGKGYGLKIWKAMWECRDSSASTCLDSVTNMVPKYESMGLKPEWGNKEYIIPLSAIAEKYKVTESSDTVSTKLLSEIEFNKLTKYDAKVYGLRRPVFIKRWTTLPKSFTWVAVNENSDVVGCITIREGADKQDAIVGPLFSDNLEIAKKLIYIASQTMSSLTSSMNLRMCVPIEKSNAIQMIENDFKLKSDYNFLRMCSRKPTVDISKVIAIYSPGYC